MGRLRIRWAKRKRSWLLESVFRLSFILKQAKNGCGFLIGGIYSPTGGAKVRKTICRSMLQKGT
jgi:hypothetical protein